MQYLLNLFTVLSNQTTTTLATNNATSNSSDTSYSSNLTTTTTITTLKTSTANPNDKQVVDYSEDYPEKEVERCYFYEDILEEAFRNQEIIENLMSNISRNETIEENIKITIRLFQDKSGANPVMAEQRVKLLETIANTIFQNIKLNEEIVSNISNTWTNETLNAIKTIQDHPLKEEHQHDFFELVTSAILGSQKIDEELILKITKTSIDETIKGKIINAVFNDPKFAEVQSHLSYLSNISRVFNGTFNFTEAVFNETKLNETIEKNIEFAFRSILDYSLKETQRENFTEEITREFLRNHKIDKEIISNITKLLDIPTKKGLKDDVKRAIKDIQNYPVKDEERYHFFEAITNSIFQDQNINEDLIKNIKRILTKEKIKEDIKDIKNAFETLSIDIVSKRCQRAISGKV